MIFQVNINDRRTEIKLNMPSALKQIYWSVAAGGGVPGEYLSDRLFLMQQYWMTFGQLSLFVRPRTFNELLYYKMLHTRDPRMQIATEKVTARNYAASKIGDGYLVPLHHVGCNAGDIPFRDLPDRFVVKASHGSGFVRIVADKSRIDEDAIRAEVAGWLALDWYVLRREWAYKGIARRVMVEQLLIEHGGLPVNYRLYAFGGRVRMIAVLEPAPLDPITQPRDSGGLASFFDETWRRMAVRMRRRPPAIPPKRPDNLAEMIDVAERLAADFAFCRVDLYNVHGRIYFSEITQYPSAGMRRWTPPDFDRALGEMWRNGTPFPERFFDPPEAVRVDNAVHLAHGAREP